MKKVLILAYDFPPYNSIGGQRPYSWYKYFKELELYPIVVTRHWDLKIENPVDYIKPSINRKVEIENTIYGTIIKTPFSPNLRDKMILKFGLYRYSFFRRILTFFYQLFEFVFPLFDNKNNIYLGANDYLKDNQVDCIIATGEPFILFKYASKLSSKFNIPWIADYRDGWSTNYGFEYFCKYEKFIKKTFLRFIEKRIIKKANIVISVSELLVANLKKLHKRKLISTILNGYDNVAPYISNYKTSVFTISYAGTIYPHQRLEIFLQAAKEIIQTGKILEINFYGIEFYPEQFNRLKKECDRLNLVVNTTLRISKKEVKEKLFHSDLLLLLANEKIDGSCAKIFDYLALNKKIILCVNDSATLNEILIDTNSGFICNDKSDVINAINNSYIEWESTGIVKCNSSNVEKYSRKEQARKLCELIQTRII